MTIRTETDAKYLVDRLNQTFKNATRYLYPDPGSMIELGGCMREIECELSRIPELQTRIKELETENAKLIIETSK